MKYSTEIHKMSDKRFLIYFVIAVMKREYISMTMYKFTEIFMKQQLQVRKDLTK